MCGKHWYLNCGNTINYYRCSTMYRRGPRDTAPTCGAPALRHREADAVVLKGVSECFTDLAVIAELWKGIAGPPSDARDSAKEITRLEGRRERILEERIDGLITREKCNEKIAALDRELQMARAAMNKAPIPAIDPKRLAAGLVRTFAGFERQPFEFQRDLLREGVREIVVEGQAFVRLTFRGHFLGRVAGEPSFNLAARSNTASTPNAITSFPTRKTNSRGSTPPS